MTEVVLDVQEVRSVLGQMGSTRVFPNVHVRFVFRDARQLAIVPHHLVETLPRDRGVIARQEQRAGPVAADAQPRAQCFLFDLGERVLERIRALEPRHLEPAILDAQVRELEHAVLRGP